MTARATQRARREREVERLARSLAKQTGWAWHRLNVGGKHQFRDLARLWSRRERASLRRAAKRAGGAFRNEVVNIMDGRLRERIAGEIELSVLGGSDER